MDLQPYMLYAGICWFVHGPMTLHLYGLVSAAAGCDSSSMKEQNYWQLVVARLSGTATGGVCQICLTDLSHAEDVAQRSNCNVLYDCLRMTSKSNRRWSVHVTVQEVAALHEDTG